MAHFPDIVSMADVPRIHARDRGDSTALIFGERRQTYRAWDANTSRVGHALVQAGVRPQGRIAFLDKNSDHYFEILFGAAKANIVTVGVNWRLAPPEAAYVINDAGAEILFVGEGFYGLVDAIRVDLKSVRTIIAMQGGRPDWESYEVWRDRHPATDPQRPIKPDDVAIQLYTSGTTGHPKGAMLTNRNFLQGRATQTGLGWNDWSPDDVSLVAMPIFHIGGAGWGFNGLYNGARNVVLPEFSPAAMLKAVREHKISKLFLVPAAMKFVIDYPSCAETDFSSIKYILYGASPIPLDLLRRAMTAFGCGFVQVYGMTETTGSITYLPPEDHDANGNRRMRSAGKPFPNVEIAVLDENGKPLGPNQVGEIATRSIYNMKGYWNLDAATKKTFTPDGWLKTGDAGYLDEDGYVYIHDRVKDMIVSGGENIYPAEVESAIYGHPAIADVAVIGVPDEKWGEAVKACVVLKPGAVATEADIIAYARSRIAGFKCPKSIDIIPALPRNPSGKILKKELRAPYWVGYERQVN